MNVLYVHFCSFQNIRLLYINELSFKKTPSVQRLTYLILVIIVLRLVLYLAGGLLLMKHADGRVARLIYVVEKCEACNNFYHSAISSVRTVLQN